MPEVSARTIGTAALLMIGVASAEQPLTAFMAEHALEALNAMLDSWSVENLLTWTRPKIALVLVPRRGQYTWGITTPAADIPREPPVTLELALLSVEDTTPGLEWELQIADQVQYESGIWQKQLASTYPSVVYFEPTQPVGRLHLWPVPQAAYTLQLLPQMALTPYGAWDDVLSWPVGYQRPITYNLALELAPQYGVEPSPLIVRTAEESKLALYPINAVIGKLSLRPGRPVGGSPLGYPRGFREGWG